MINPRDVCESCKYTFARKGSKAYRLNEKQICRRCLENALQSAWKEFEKLERAQRFLNTRKDDVVADIEAIEKQIKS